MPLNHTNMQSLILLMTIYARQKHDNKQLAYYIKACHATFLKEQYYKLRAPACFQARSLTRRSKHKV
jgi:hypothetical protein